MRSIHLLVLAFGLVIPGAAIAANNFRQACEVDKLCAGVKPAGGGIMRCLKEHKTELSDECKIAIADRILNQQNKKDAGNQSAKPAASGDDTPPQQ